ncbi:cysteine dioxygenase family protein [Pseudoxanthomonas sp.]|uniref:cysteine dioxygenase family protein n=1 Tax=Pseudoxanthomonas sp. TaxID=1871049 RepID=UPI0026176433|nr:cysteine dioxygenase family protein [Pseudoxanthomonas sp.]WDS36539.1 MAG: cysteine dioxygenase family protein [Pseudoxanthomonas sp.]
MPLQFPGKDRLIRALDAAVALGDDHAVAEALRDTLASLIVDTHVQLPALVQQPAEDHYARRELYVSPEHGYSVVAMTWGPRQGTQIHDHAGVWCVEGVWQGQLEITQYALAEHVDSAYRFTAADTQLAEAGSAGALIPPHEYHTIRNASDADIAVSLHVYKHSLDRCGIYLADAQRPGWMQCEDRTIHSDPLPAEPATH